MSRQKKSVIWDTSMLPNTCTASISRNNREVMSRLLREGQFLMNLRKSSR